MKHFISIVFGIVALGLIFVPQTALAGIDSVLGEIEWGDTKDEVIQKLRTEKLAELREDRALRNDSVAMQRARQRTLDEIRRIEDSHTQLQGSRTGFEVSVVAGEFTSDNGESVMRVRDDIAQRYYFFLDGKLYKLVVAYEQDYISNVGFEAFLNQATQRYGRPNSTDYGKVLGEESVIQAVFKDDRSELRIDDRREFYGTFTMSFSDLVTAERLAELDREFGGSDRDDSQVSSRVQALQETSAVDPNAGVVDGLVGTIEVDLGREEKKEEEAEESSSRPSAPAASSAPREEATPRRRAPARRAAPPEDEDDLVIY